MDVVYLWMQDEIRSKRLRVRIFNSEENVADLGTKPLSKAVIAKHCLALGYVNMAEASEVQDVAMCCDSASVQIGGNAKGKDPNLWQKFITGDRLPAWRSQLVTMPRKVRVR